MDYKSKLVAQVPSLAPLWESADHVDVKVVEGEVSLREFLAGMFTYYPAWLKALYQVRGGFVRVLGMKQEGVPIVSALRPEEIPMEANESLLFFTVHDAKEGHYWVAGATESHLTARLGVVAEPVGGRQRFYLVTLVHYHNWSGPVYFNVIRPFHHLVVQRMAEAGRRYRRPQPPATLEA